MTLNSNPRISFVMATHNRRSVVLHTLDRIAECGLAAADYEVVIVDNASTDGTCEAVEGRVSELIRMGRNLGSCAKTCALDRLKGEFVVFLDDDSHPRPGSIERMIKRFEDDPSLGAAGFAVHLPDGRQESGALPGVFVGCGVGLRLEALRAVGGLDRTFFMQAEEYDLSFKLERAGWRVEVFDDLHVEHLKTAQSRKSNRTTYYDIRNNLRVIARHLPDPYYRIYRQETLLRYRWLAEFDGHETAYRRGAVEGCIRAPFERFAHRSRRLTPALFERFYRLVEVESNMHALASTGVRRVVLAQFGKNICAFHRGAGRAGIEVVAIADDRFCAPGRCYRGAPVVPLARGLELTPDALVVANMSPVHARKGRQELLLKTSVPVYDWYGLPDERSSGGNRLIAPSITADKRPSALPALV